MADTAHQAEMARLVLEHHAALYAYAYRLTGSQVDAEDLTQTVFLIAHRKLHQVRLKKSIRGWLYTILRNCYLKSRRGHHDLSATAVEMDLNGLEDLHPRDTEIDAEALQAAIDKLPDEYKLVVMMFYFEGSSYTEISRELELPMGTVMSRLSRSRDHLRRSLLARELTLVPTTSGK
jgi:RNA polymerase sigma-70 factor (ECF subfamily)